MEYFWSLSFSVFHIFHDLLLDILYILTLLLESMIGHINNNNDSQFISLRLQGYWETIIGSRSLILIEHFNYKELVFTSEYLFVVLIVDPMD